MLALGCSQDRSFPIALILAALPAWSCGDDDGGPCQCPADQVINCGHRGTGQNSQANDFPENTLPSFERAVLEGADMVELDVQHSSDGALVVIHDDEVDRTTDSTGCVGDYTIAELQEMDAGHGTPLAGSGVFLPTLEEVFDAVDAAVNVEIKVSDTAGCPPSDRAALAEDVVTAIASDTKDRLIVVSSFDLDVLLEVQDLEPSIPLGYLSLVASDAQVAAASGMAALNVLGGLLGEDDIADILALGLDANVWTINDPGMMDSFLSWGVDMIITDEPELLEERRESFCNLYCGASD
ncbi:MAG: glycerophosphodiester phosphodiesterase family protein [Polyangia bacterium]|jgi:glycerophosphoryl diester phosphodiesterase|nr:glycerophosphodiester phosphodiesterase family protein [Polyangia bacterium]